MMSSSILSRSLRHRAVMSWAQNGLLSRFWSSLHSAKRFTWRGTAADGEKSDWLEQQSSNMALGRHQVGRRWDPNR
jgi:hypothetical protein